MQSKLWLRKLLCISLLSLSFVACISQANAANPKILVFGDSLSAAYGIPKSQGWVALLQKKLADQHYQYDVINASISGETTSGGLTRLETALSKVQPNIIIIELGANDGLRGLPVKEMTENLNTMITQSKKANAKILLIGMKIPPNYGPKYTEAFRNTYPDLSLQHKVSLVPFLLENVAAQPKLIQDDGLHPNVSGQPILLDNIWPKLKPLLKR
ncbi:arylesterase [Methylotenera sp.]|uniref:arylesterase n=1 Tax=Methylotenera sp. TaxID=2051956 RepID=UPI002487DF95|nr:arylesterase [Methylotenera sp.]MDI1298172.1 arylesterase [Methylotenera sp.]